MDKLAKAKEILVKYNQEHIKIENEKQAEQILNINFEQLKDLYEETKKEIKNIENIEPVKAINPEKLENKDIEKYIHLGEEIIKSGKFAISIMAGGQGTRLGHNGPKGTFKLELNSKIKSLFEVAVDKLKEAKAKYNIYLMCYIMTSQENYKDTIEFFVKNNFFGYPQDKIKFFIQGELPLLDKQGKLINGEDGLIKVASDGNGGIFSSMQKNGIIADMKNKGIEWIFIGSIDNLLVQYVDSLLLGITINNHKKIATKTIVKNSPYEKVGVLCKKNGKVNVIEYTELPEEMRLAKDENGEILYGESHIMCNLYNIEAIEKLASKNMKYHVAEKKAKYIDENGNLVIPQEPNCYKFEKFIFDSFCLFEDIVIVRGKREENFAPIKNAEGEDSPETAKKMYEEYHKKHI